MYKKCNPKRRNEKYKYGCYTKKNIQNFIKKSPSNLNVDIGDLKTVKQLMKDKKCYSNECWSNIDPKNFDKNALIPISKWAITGPNAFLISQFEIDEVLKQYNGINNFIYHGSIDIDVSEINLKNKFTAITVYCYGKSIKYSKHWVAFFINKDKIQYFDSESDQTLRYM